MSVMEIFCDEVLLVRINYCKKLDNPDVWPLSVEKEAQFCTILNSILVKKLITHPLGPTKLIIILLFLPSYVLGHGQTEGKTYG